LARTSAIDEAGWARYREEEKDEDKEEERQQQTKGDK
jgi:hypothetical protein